MNTEDMLSDLFAHEADRRPDSATVLDAVHQRIAQRGRIAGVRAASALGAVATVAVIAVSASVLTAPSGHHADPAGGAPQSTPATTAPATRTTTALATDTSTPQPSDPSVSSPAGGRSYSTINAGWLPGPAKQNPAGTSNGPGFEERDWDVTVDGVAMDVIIWTESGSLPSQMQATGGQSDYLPITVNGHPGREFVSANVTIIAFDLGNGTVAYVGPSVQQKTATITSARIAAIAVKVADNMQFNQHDPFSGR